jgi:hypothetical protein
MNRVGAIVFVCVGFVFVGHAFGRGCPVDAGFRGSTYSIDRYKNRFLIKAVENLNQISEPVREKLIEHLRSKLGEKFFRRLKFGGGEWIDLEALKRESPKDHDWNAPMGAYDLIFRFSDPEKGLKYFYSTVVVDDDGSIRKDIYLPDIADHPEKSKIIPCQQAVVIAQHNGFPKQSINVTFDYSPDEATFVWIVTDSRGTTPDKTLLGIKGKGTFKTMEINANTGHVVKIYKATMII